MPRSSTARKGAAIQVIVPGVWACRQLSNAAYKSGYRSGYLGAYPSNPYSRGAGKAWYAGHATGLADGEVARAICVECGLPYSEHSGIELHRFARRHEAK